MSNKLRQDENGLGHILLIVLVLVVLAGVGVAGWMVMNGKKTTTNTSTSNSSAGSKVASSTVDSSCLSTYHDANLCKFAANSTSFEKTAYTATVTTEQNGTNSTLTLENDGMGNTRLSGTESGQTFNSIMLNGVTYLQPAGIGPWIEYPASSSAPTTNPTSSMDIAVGSNGITYKALGTEACGSLTCYKYQVTDSATPNATQIALFDNTSYKLRQWQYTDGSSSTNMVITYGAVNITKPSPVESLPSVSQ